MRLLLAFISIFLSAFAFNVEILEGEIANGKTALLEFKKEKGFEYNNVVYNKKSFKVFKHPSDAKKLYALIPISYYEKPKNQEIKIQYTQNTETKSKNIFLKITDGNYSKETITVDPSKVNPKGKELTARIAKEYHQAMKIYNTVTQNNYLDSAFIMPMESKIMSSFGKARIYNGSLKGYHSGTDFRAKTGTDIIAVNTGKVVLVQDRFYSGGTVLLDHGEGIYTCYFHMSNFSVKVGEMVRKGQKLGLSGQSGRVTGPHLHFSARINGVQVDPLQLISLMNDNLLKGK